MWSGLPHLFAVTGLAASGVLLIYTLLIAAGCWVLLKVRRPIDPVGAAR